MIHEGTHGIQAMDLLGRKVLADKGRGMSTLASRVEATIDRAQADSNLAVHANALGIAFHRVQAAGKMAWADDDRMLALANSTAYLQSFGHMVIAWIWLDVAIAARRALLSGGAHGDDFYLGKLQATKYFYCHELPKIYPWLSVVESRDPTCLDMHDAWF
jgi:butyryl-CoA dehydrogenase